MCVCSQFHCSCTLRGQQLLTVCTGQVACHEQVANGADLMQMPINCDNLDNTDDISVLHLWKELYKKKDNA